MIFKRCALRNHFARSAHIYRQISATLAASLLQLSAGITYGYSAVLLPQLKDDHNFPYQKSLDSWIASILPLAMIFGCLIAGDMSDRIGRRMGQILIIPIFIIGWIIIGISTNNTMIIIGRFITGLCTGASRPFAMVYISELAKPKYRSIALICPSLAMQIGILTSHSVGKYVYWKTSSFLFTIFNIVTLIILLVSNESPLWLLSKGKIDEGIESFKLFRGDDEISNKELLTVLEKCTVKTEESSFKDSLNIVFNKPFMKSLGNMLIIFMAVQWSGINSLTFYAEEVFKKTFSSKIDPTRLMFATDCIKMPSLIATCFVVKIMSRKKTYISSCFCIAVTLLSLVTYLYFVPSKLEWLAVTCIVIFFVMSSSLVCTCWTFMAELFPVQLRGLGSGLSSAISFVMLFIMVNITPGIINTFGVMAMYSGFVVVAIITGVLLIITLPEMEGKSMQEIENTLYKNNDSKLEAVNVSQNQNI